MSCCSRLRSRSAEVPRHPERRGSQRRRGRVPQVCRREPARQRSVDQGRLRTRYDRDRALLDLWPLHKAFGKLSVLEAAPQGRTTDQRRRALVRLGW